MDYRGRIEEIRERTLANTKITNFSEWNTMAHGDCLELLEIIDEYSKKIKELEEITEKMKYPPWMWF